MESRNRSTSHPNSNLIGRRALLRGSLAGAGLLGGVVLLDACGGSEPTERTLARSTDQTLTPMFPRDVAYIPAGIASRLIYTISDAEGVPAMELPKPASFEVRLDDKKVGETVEVNSHGDGVPRAYYPLTFTFPEAGTYDIIATVDGKKLDSQVIVSPPDEVKIPYLGTTLPSVDTPTTEHTLDVDPICTRSPACPFHKHNLADVLGTGTPVVVLLATPAYCQTTACGPILDLLVDEAAGLPDNVIVIHSEVYKDPKTVDDIRKATLAPLPLAFNMSFEPSLFVTDAANKVVARGDIAVDRADMAQMLALAR